MPSTSAKQHRLMQAVARSPKFAKKVGIPQTVGQHYMSADKSTGRYAGGGRVSKLGNLVDRYLSDLKASTGVEPQQGRIFVSGYEPNEMGGSSPLGTGVYLKHLFSVKPDLTDKQKKFLQFGVPAAAGQSPEDLRRLFKRAGLGDVADDLVPMINYQPNVGVSFNEIPGLGDSLIEHVVNKGRSPDELSEALKYRSNIQSTVKPVNKKASGGSVAKSSDFADIMTGLLDLPERNPTLLEKALQGGNRLARMEDQNNITNPRRNVLGTKLTDRGDKHKALLLKGIASMIGTYNDKTGQVEYGTHPGLIDELVGLPASFSSSAPGWSQQAKRRTDKLRARISDEMSDVTPVGLGENITESVGEMLGQIPLPAGAIEGLASKIAAKTPAALRYASKIPGSIMEYLSPSIHPTLGNYVSGSVAGGAMGRAGDPSLLTPADFNEDAKYLEGETMSFPDSPKYGGGGKVGRLKAIMQDFPYLKAKKTGYGDEVRVAPRNMPKGREEDMAAYDDINNILSGGTLGPMHNEVFVGPVKKGDGGKVGRSARAMKAIKDAIGHLENNDRSSAIKTLSTADTASDPEVTRIISMLRGPQASSAVSPLRQVVEADTNATIMPTFGKGGEVNKVLEKIFQTGDLVKDSAGNKYKVSYVWEPDQTIRAFDSDGNHVSLNVSDVTLARRAKGSFTKYNAGGKVEHRYGDGGKVRQFFKVVTTNGGVTKAVLDDENKAWNLADRLQGVSGRGHHAVAATEDEFNTFHSPHLPPINKGDGGKVVKALKSFKLADWKDALTPETRSIVDRLDQQAKERRVLPDRRANPRFSLDNVDISDVLSRRKPYVVKPDDLE